MPLDFHRNEYYFIFMLVIPVSKGIVDLVTYMISGRHQLLPDDDLGPLYDLLIDEPPEIRHAIGALVYDHLIAQKFNSSQLAPKGYAQLCHFLEMQYF